MAGFAFHPELFGARGKLLAALTARDLRWFSDFSSIDVLHDEYGLEVCGIRERETAIRIGWVMVRLFDEWDFGALFLVDWQSAILIGDRLLEVGDMSGALASYLSTLASARLEAPGDPLAGPATLDRVRLETRLATCYFTLGARPQGRKHLTKAARLAERTAWSPGGAGVAPTWDSETAQEGSHWERVTECAGYDDAELIFLATLLRHWASVYFEQNDGGVRGALPFWELVDRLHERRLRAVGARS